MMERPDNFFENESGGHRRGPDAPGIFFAPANVFKKKADILLSASHLHFHQAGFIRCRFPIVQGETSRKNELVELMELV